MGEWLRRYFGFLFDFKHFSNLIWLTIPLFIYSIVTIKKRKRWEIALGFVIILSIMLFGLRGVETRRYYLTVVPFLLGITYLSLWKYLEKKSRSFQIGFFILCGIAVSLNFYLHRETFQYWWESRVTLKPSSFSFERLEFINKAEDINSESIVLVCSYRHLFYYHTDKPSIYFVSTDPRVDFLYREKNRHEALNILKNQLKVKYILLHWNFKLPLNLKWIIRDHCDLVIEDRDGYLYKIKEKNLNKKELEKIFVNDSLLKNGSFENWDFEDSNFPDNWKSDGGIFNVQKETSADNVFIGTNSVKLTGDINVFVQTVPNYKNFLNKHLICFVWMKTNIPQKYRIQLWDGVSVSYSKYHSGSGKWELLQANHEVNELADRISLRPARAVKKGNPDDVAYFDGVLLIEGDWNTFYLYREFLREKREYSNGL